MKYYIHTYGCQMNIHDSEKIAGILRDMGYDECNSPEEADVVVFNTCCIRETAEKKIYGHIGQMKKLKRKKPNLIVAVCGCMSQQEGASEHIRQSYPFVDVVLGTGNLNMLRQGIENAGRQRLFNTDFCCVREEDFPQYRTSYPNAWVNINYGCNNFCTYCIVPYVRGRERSRRPEDILAEVKGLLSDGYKEITLLGQNVNSYGKDIEGASFASLLREIGKLPGKFRLRFMTSHPKDLTQDIIDAVAEHKNICNNVHLPVQSGSSRILKAMNRRYDRESYLALVERIKECIPDVGITTDIMVGFPGETEEDFEATLDMVEKIGYSAAYTFKYSPRTGTKAATMDEQISEDVKKERLKRLNDTVAKGLKAGSEKYIGQEGEVLVEGCDHRGEPMAYGKLPCFKMVYFKGDESMIGSLRRVRITGITKNSLVGELI